MPLPWLIGAAVVGVAAAIISSDDDDRPSRRVTSRSDDSEEKKQKAKQERLDAFIQTQVNALADKYQFENSESLKKLLYKFKDADETHDLSMYLSDSVKHRKLLEQQSISGNKSMELKRALEMLKEV